MRLNREATAPSPRQDVNVQVKVVVDPGADHRNNKNEYSQQALSLFRRIQESGRQWLNPDERLLLSELAERLPLQEWEKSECERAAQERLGFTLQPRPTELWHIAAGEQQVAREKPRPEAIVVLADCLAGRDPDSIVLWRRGLKDWVDLKDEKALLEEAYESLLLKAAREKRLSTLAGPLEWAARHIDHKAAQRIRRAVEEKVGRPLVLGKAPATVHGPVAAPQGVFNHATNAGVSIDFRRDIAVLAQASPSPAVGHFVVGTLSEGDGGVMVELRHARGDFAGISGLTLTRTKNSICVRAVQSSSSSAAASAFRGDYQPR